MPTDVDLISKYLLAKGVKPSDPEFAETLGSLGGIEKPSQLYSDAKAGKIDFSTLSIDQKRQLNEEDKRVEAFDQMFGIPAAAMAGGMRTALPLGKYHVEKTEVEKRHPIASGAGAFAGYMAPITGITKATNVALKGAPLILRGTKLGRLSAGIAEGLAFAGYEGREPTIIDIGAFGAGRILRRAPREQKVARAIKSATEKRAQVGTPIISMGRVRGLPTAGGALTPRPYRVLPKQLLERSPIRMPGTIRREPTAVKIAHETARADKLKNITGAIALTNIYRDAEGNLVLQTPSENYVFGK